MRLALARDSILRRAHRWFSPRGHQSSVICRKVSNRTRNVRTSTRSWSRLVRAVLAATLAMIVVFVPVLFVQGQAGQLFRDISIAIACSVGISMIVSVTVIPAAACWLLRDQRNANLEYDMSFGPSGLFGLVRFSHWINEWFARAMRTIMSARGSWLWR